MPWASIRGGGNAISPICKFHFGDETVAFPRNCFDVGGNVIGVAEDPAELVDGGIDVSLEVDVGVRRPQTDPQRVTQNHLARSFEQSCQDFINLSRDAQAGAVAKQLLPLEVQVKRTKLCEARRKTALGEISPPGPPPINPNTVKGWHPGILQIEAIKCRGDGGAGPG